MTTEADKLRAQMRFSTDPDRLEREARRTELVATSGMVKAAIAVLLEVHTTGQSKDGIVGIRVGARPEYWHSQEVYSTAWQTLYDVLYLK